MWHMIVIICRTHILFILNRLSFKYIFLFPICIFFLPWNSLVLFKDQFLKKILSLSPFLNKAIGSGNSLTLIENNSRFLKALMPITFSSPRAQPEVVYFLISNESPYFSDCKSKISDCPLQTSSILGKFLDFCPLRNIICPQCPPPSKIWCCHWYLSRVTNPFN